MPDPTTIGTATLYQGDCLDIAPALGQFAAIITDPPYGRVKGDFDHVWTNRQAMLSDARHWRDILTAALLPNGTLWWFAWPTLAGRLEALIAETLNPLAHVVWRKPCPQGQKCRKEALRAPMPETERILMFEHYGADHTALGLTGYAAKCAELRGFIFEPLRAYLADEWQRAGLTPRDAERATGTQMATHWFTRSQWALPTEPHYRTLQARANQVATDVYLRRDYEYLRRDYEYLRRDYEDLRRHFDCRPGDQYSDVWTFDPPKVRHGHPTEKPIELLAYLVRLSVRPGQICFDPFMGSGTTGVAAALLGRPFVGIEKDPRWFDLACRRIETAHAQGALFDPSHDQPPPKPQQHTIDLTPTPVQPTIKPNHELEAGENARGASRF